MCHVTGATFASRLSCKTTSVLPFPTWIPSQRGCYLRPLAGRKTRHKVSPGTRSAADDQARPVAARNFDDRAVEAGTHRDEPFGCNAPSVEPANGTLNTADFETIHGDGADHQVVVSRMVHDLLQPVCEQLLGGVTNCHHWDVPLDANPVDGVREVKHDQGRSLKEIGQRRAVHHDVHFGGRITHDPIIHRRILAGGGLVAEPHPRFGGPPVLPIADRWTILGTSTSS